MTPALLNRTEFTGVCGRMLELFDRSGACYRLIPHAPEGRTDEASRLRGHSLDRAAKCIVVRVKKGKRHTRYALAVVPGDRRVDLEGIKRHYGGSYASFALRETAEQLTGCVCGSIIPFAFDPELELLVAPELLQHDEIFFNAARLDLSVALATRDYLAMAEPLVMSIAEPRGNGVNAE